MPAAGDGVADEGGRDLPMNTSYRGPVT